MLVLVSRQEVRMAEMVLPGEVEKMIEGREVLGFVTGPGFSRDQTGTIVVTDREVMFYDPMAIGAAQIEIPFSHIMNAVYVNDGRLSFFTVATQFDSETLRLSGPRKIVHEPALALFRLLREKLSEILTFPISEFHSKSPAGESWRFFPPPQWPSIGARKPEDSVPDQIRQLANLKDDGMLTVEEFEAKKKELLARL